MYVPAVQRTELSWKRRYLLSMADRRRTELTREALGGAVAIGGLEARAGNPCSNRALIACRAMAAGWSAPNGCAALLHRPCSRRADALPLALQLQGAGEEQSLRCACPAPLARLLSSQPVYGRCKVSCIHPPMSAVGSVAHAASLGRPLLAADGPRVDAGGPAAAASVHARWRHGARQPRRPFLG